MRTLENGLTIPKMLQVRFQNNQTENCLLLGAGGFNAAYVTASRTRVPKIPLSQLTPEDWSTKIEASTELSHLAALMDSPARCVAIWNQYIRPRLVARAQTLGLPQDLPALVPAEICSVHADHIKTALEAWVSPYLATTPPRITTDEINTLVVEIYRGDARLNIPGGRIFADAVSRDNIVRWYGILLPIDPGSLFCISKHSTHRRVRSEASQLTWFENKEAQTDHNFFRENTFRYWFAESLFERNASGIFLENKQGKMILLAKPPVYKKTQLLLAAICYLAKHRPQYLDLSILLTNLALTEACAYLFLDNDCLANKLPNFNKNEALVLFNASFPDISTYPWSTDADQWPYHAIIERYNQENATPPLIEIALAYKNILSALQKLNLLTAPNPLQNTPLGNNSSASFFAQIPIAFIPLEKFPENVEDLSTMNLTELLTPKQCKRYPILSDYLAQLEVLQNRLHAAQESHLQKTQ